MIPLWQAIAAAFSMFWLGYFAGSPLVRKREAS